jgi:hypothetical protein
MAGLIPEVTGPAQQKTHSGRVSGGAMADGTNYGQNEKK